ncbi:acetyltransferase [Ancylomarina sp. 16SWW S1-10-2]|uniref:acetyltransferase n=1 Tax=Ancylomarina sp. 16SWW S1-10-2 TaxID=2499681 RepID=UPI0012AD783D|nr:acetyltransferase [Ancylomarina sp. 16SWW S1-10-2]MRT93421.1 acetyltransferase [Ancylomarina sp. 16SWW S1-10-2]
MKDRNYLLYGGSGHAKVVVECIKANHGNVMGFFDDNPELTGFKDVPFLGAYRSENHTHPLIVAIGDNRIRKRIVEQVRALFGSIQHPSASISPTAQIGEGTVIIRNAILQVDCKIGRHVILNTGSSVGHECTLSDFVHISPQATLCGNVKVGEGTQIGAGATVIPGIKIGSWGIIGAGAVIIRDVPDYAIVVGNPGRIIRYYEPQQKLWSLGDSLKNKSNLSSSL